ncbi:hypothetical protein Tco_0409996 [Tanacetum coccineum]
MDRPMTPSQLRQYMRTYVKNQGPAVYSTGWTMAQVRKLTPEQLQEEEEAGATLLKMCSSQEEVAAPSHSQDIPDAPVKAPSTTTSTAQHIGSSPKKVGTRKKRLGRKGVHPSHSTIPIEDGDPEAEHKMCIKYASDADSASDDDTPVNLFAVDKQAEGVGLVLWGDLKVLMDSPEVNDVDGLVIHMFVDKKYPLSINLIERMLDHQLDI